MEFLDSLNNYMKNEQLHTHEQTPTFGQPQKPEYTNGTTSYASVLDLRERQFESIRQALSKKYQFKIEEKLQGERKAFKDIAFSQEKTSAHIARYTFLLDPNFFEQKFLSL